MGAPRGVGCTAIERIDEPEGSDALRSARGLVTSPARGPWSSALSVASPNPDVRHLDFTDCGHVVVRPWPQGQAPPMPFDNGGTDEALDAAHDVALPAVVRHLRGDD